MLSMVPHNEPPNNTVNYYVPAQWTALSYPKVAKPTAVAVAAAVAVATAITRQAGRCVARAAAAVADSAAVVGIAGFRATRRLMARTENMVTWIGGREGRAVEKPECTQCTMLAGCSLTRKKDERRCLCC